MPPVKFDDIPKVSKSILDDDYQVSGYQLVGKQKTNFDGAVSTLTVDVLPGQPVVTPAKVSLKFPKPLGIVGFPIDKLEMDKSGKFKLEVSMSKDMHQVPDLVIDAKCDPFNLAKATKGLTYSGIKDTLIKVETKPMSPMDFTFEATKTMGLATVGMKCAGVGTPDLGIRMASGPYFASLVAKEKLKTFTTNVFYKVSDDLKLAATYTQGGKASGSYTAGLAYSLAKGTSVKAKIAQDMAVCASVKHELAKGMTAIAGCKYAGGKTTYGLKLSLD
mmetsp:Transcript_18041/g.32184  ORF Transcript_18041/g.32184 Transcript_18041/m.32184 type:complete len:275 (+) Transcript_18041:72-896(+)